MRVKLGDVAIESRETYRGDKNGIPIVGLEHLVPEEVNLTDWNVDAENTFSKFFHKGQILFGRRRAYLKKAAVAPCDGICSGDITVIAAKTDDLAPELLPFIIQNDRFFDFAVEKSAGSLSPRAKWEHLKNFEFDLPPIDEQRRLAEVLWAFDDTKQAYKRLIVLTDELVKARFVEMFGEPVTTSKYERKSISKFGEVLTGTTPPMKKTEYYDSDDIMFIKPSDIKEDCVTNIEISEAYVSENARKAARIIPGGTVLVTCIGTIGKVGIVTQEVTFNQQINVIVPNKNSEALYIAHCLLYMKNALVEAANAPVVPIINKTMFSKIAIPSPPLPLQQKFAAFAESADKAKAELTHTLDELDAAYKALVREKLG